MRSDLILSAITSRPLIPPSVVVAGSIAISEQRFLYGTFAEKLWRQLKNVECIKVNDCIRTQE